MIEIRSSFDGAIELTVDGKLLRIGRQPLSMASLTSMIFSDYSGDL
jgi:hypothetical protein